MYTHKRALSLLLSLLLCLSMLSGMTVLAETTCPHTNATRTNVTYDSLVANKYGHHFVYETRVRVTCPDCGYVDSGTLADEQPDPGPVEPHTFVNGVCSVCDYACAHADKELQYTASGYEDGATPVDEFTHSGTYSEEERWDCIDCGEVFFIETNRWENYSRKHEWDENGVCYQCDFVNTCTHANKSLRYTDHDYTGEVVFVDELTHSGTYVEEEEWRCDDCGQWISIEIGREENVVRNHEWTGDGECSLCGFVNPCIHANKSLQYIDSYYDYGAVPVDELTHSGTYIEEEEWKCDVCGQIFFVEISRKQNVVNKHDWDEDGECWECGFVNTCTHANGMDVTDEYERTLKVLDRNDTEHVQLVTKCVTKECPICGFRTETDIGEPYSETSKHDWEEDYCWVCRQPNPCTHSNVRYSYYDECISVTGSDAHGHHAIYAFHKYTECVDCGATLDSQIVDSCERYEAHFDSSDDNECYICGYQNTACTHPNMVIEKYPNGSVIDVLAKSEQGHTVTVHECVVTRCPDCDYYHWEETENVCTRENEPHSWKGMIVFDGEDSCAYCGYVNPCQHANCELVDECEERINVVTANNPKDHTVMVQKRQERYCKDCGASFLDYIGDPYPVTEAHDWSKTYCISCYYPNLCEHAHVHEEVQEYAGTLVSSSQDGHTCKVIRRTLNVCDDCGANWWIDLAKETEETKLFPHTTNSNGQPSIICRICNFDQQSVTPAPVPTETPAPVATETPAPVATETPAPAATETPAPAATETPAPAVTETPTPTAAPTQKPTATEQPTLPPLEPLESEIPYEDVPETDTVHGVTAAQPQRMAETLVTVIDAIERENEGASVSISIVNVEKVVTAEEKAELDALPAKEQILVLLSAIGYDTEVQAALSSMDMELSAEAVALTQAIQERIATASDEEKAAFEALLLECFPVETVMIDGEPVDYFVIELQVEVDGEIHFERYGFRFDENGEWIFARLSISEITE